MNESWCKLLTMSAKECVVKKKYKLVPPDGGWGYMIALSSTINLSTGVMFQASFGLLYKEFMQDIGMTSTHVTTMMGIGAVCAAITGFLTSPLLTITSNRMLTFIAALILNAGVIGSVFVKTIFTFYICVGILPFIGMGFIFNVSFSLLNQYFVKKRMRVISLCQTIIALLTMTVPMFLKWSLEEYGYRGTLALVAGITMNNFIGIALIQPVEYHMKKIEIQDKEEDALLINEKELNKKSKIEPELQLADIEGNLLKSKEKMQDNKEEKNNNNGLNKIIDALFDKSLRKTFLLSCVSYGPAICIFADMTYGVMLPQALYAAAWSQDNVALALSLMGFGDLAMRIVFIFISSWLFKFGSAEVYVSGIIVALVARLGMLWTKSFTANMIFITLTGTARCCIAILIPVVIADAVLPHQFTSALGLFMMISGLISLTLGLAIGAVRDLTESYGAAFYLITSCFAIVALFWLIELCYKKSEHKRLQRKEYLSKKRITKVNT